MATVTTAASATTETGNELVSKAKARSPVWNYFGFKPGADGKPLDESTAVCRICKRSVAAKGGNTSNLFSHLKKQHPREFADAKAGTSVQSSRGSGSHDLQPTICDTIADGQRYARGSKRWQQLTDSITHCLAKDMLPIYTVEKPGFRKMLTHFDARYEIPSRKYFSQTAIPALFNTVHDTVKCEVQQAEFFSATTDMWSSRTMMPYMSYTVHFIDGSWQYKSRVLETFFLPEDHTGDNIANALRGTLESWKLGEDKQVGITTDNGSNIIKATDNLKWRRLPCFGHCLNLAVTNTIKHNDRVCRALAVARKIVSSFSMSWKKRRDLAKIQLEKSLPQHNLIAVSITIKLLVVKYLVLIS